MKILSILIIVIIICGIVVYGYYRDKQEIDVGNFKIKGTNLKSITDPIPEGKYMLCSLKE